MDMIHMNMENEDGEQRWQDKANST